MPAGFNYSKWDNLELSDDEDTHPGAQFIEKNTLRRIKRESHEIKEHERQQKIAALQAEQAAGARAAAQRARGTRLAPGRASFPGATPEACVAARALRQMTRRSASWSSRWRR
jgi:hypothetical protein